MHLTKKLQFILKSYIYTNMFSSAKIKQVQTEYIPENDKHFNKTYCINPQLRRDHTELPIEVCC